MVKLTLFIISITMPQLSLAVVISFTGGTVHQIGGNIVRTDSTKNYTNVNYYEEDGFRFNFIGSSGEKFSYHVGTYYPEYGAANELYNDVIHGHWAKGPHGNMESILVHKIDKTAFDLNYFTITTNTDSGGSPSSGNEKIYINALLDGVNISHSKLLPSDDWGRSGNNPGIKLGVEFDNILAFSFTYGDQAVGFGADNFYIDEEAPTEP